MNPNNFSFNTISLSSLSKRNKVIIIVVAIILILLLFLMTIFVKRGSSNEPISIIPGSSAPHAFPTVAPYEPFPNGGRYRQATYSISYPQGSQNTASVFIGGSTFIIQPPDSAGYPNEPVFDVEAYTSAQNLAQKQASYLATGATKDTIAVNNISLPELKNTYGMRTINSKPIQTPTQLRLAYLVKPNALYVFRMYYSSSVSVQADEDLFLQFIKSFSLN